METKAASKMGGHKDREAHILASRTYMYKRQWSKMNKATWSTSGDKSHTAPRLTTDTHRHREFPHKQMKNYARVTSCQWRRRVQQTQEEVQALFPGSIMNTEKGLGGNWLSRLDKHQTSQAWQECTGVSKQNQAPTVPSEPSEMGKHKGF